MTKTVETKPRHMKGEPGEGSISLARLHQECHRFREEVLCIRSYPRLRRWPSFARLEIGDESSEEDDTMWDATDAQTRDPSSCSRTASRTAEINTKKSEEFPSQKRVSFVDTKESAEDERLGAAEFPFIISPRPADVGASRKIIDVSDVDRECGVGWVNGAHWRDRREESATRTQGSNPQKLDVHPLFGPIAAVKEVSNPSHADFHKDPEGKQGDRNGLTMIDFHTDSGARIAATALFTANPRYNSYELSTECDAHGNFRCQSEGFELNDEVVGSDETLHPPHGHLGNYCCSYLPPAAPKPLSDSVVREEDQVRLEVKSPYSTVSADQSCCSHDEDHHNSTVDDLQKKDRALTSAGCALDRRKFSSSIAKTPGTDCTLSELIKCTQERGSEECGGQNQNRLAKTSGGDFVRQASVTCEGSEPLRCSPYSSSHQQDFSTSMSRQVSTRTDLVNMAGMEKFATLGCGSTRDSVLAVLMGMRIKEAFEGLEGCRNKNNGRRNCRAHEEGVGCSGLPNSRQKTSLDECGAAVETTAQKLGVRKARSPGNFFENSEAGGLQSDYRTTPKHCEHMLGCGQAKTKFLEAKSRTPVEPDLYLQDVIAELDSGSEAEVAVSFLAGTVPSSTRGLLKSQCPILHQVSENCRVGKLLDPQTGAHSFNLQDQMCMCLGSEGEVAECKAFDNFSAVRPHTVTEKSTGNDETCGGEVTHGFPSKGPRNGAAAEDQSAFSVQIRSPAGSPIQVDVGGHVIVCGQLERAFQPTLNNSLHHPSNLSHPESSNLQIARGKYSPQRNSPGATSRGRLNDSPGNGIFGSSTLTEPKFSDPKNYSVQNRLGTPELLPLVDLARPNVPRPVTFSARKEPHDFDERLTHLIQKANQLEEESKFPSFSLEKEQRAKARQGALEVTKAQRPSILKSSAQSKFLKTVSDSSTQSESQASETAEKLQAFGNAAAELAQELQMLMNARRLGMGSDDQGQKQRRVVWAFPEARVLESGPALRSKRTKQGRQECLPKHTHHPSEESAAYSKHSGLDDVSAWAVQPTREAEKAKSMQRRQYQNQPRFTNYPKSPQYSSYTYSYSKQGDAPITAKQVSRVSKHKSDQIKSLQEKGLARAKKIFEDFSGGPFNYAEFCQELRELQAERKRLEQLMRTIFSPRSSSHELVVVEQSYGPAVPIPQERNKVTASVKHTKKTRDGRATNVSGGSTVETSYKRRKLADSILPKSGMEATHSVCDRLHFPEGRANDEGRCIPARSAAKMLKSQNRGQLAGESSIGRRDLDPPGNYIEAGVISSDSGENKNTRKDPHQIQQQQGVERCLRGRKFDEKPRLTSEVSRDPSSLDKHDEGLAYCPQCRNTRVTGFREQSSQHDVINPKDSQDKALSRILNSSEHPSKRLGCSNAKHDHETLSDLNDRLGKVHEPLLDSSICSASAFPVKAIKSKYFKDYFLQGSSTLLQPHCVTHSGVQEVPSEIKPAPSKDVTQVEDDCIANTSQEVISSVDIVEGRVGLSIRSSDLKLRVPGAQHHRDLLLKNVQPPQQGDEHRVKVGEASYHQKSETTSGSSRPPFVGSTNVLKGRKSEPEKMKMESNMGPRNFAQENNLKATSSEKETSCSGSLNSVLEAYKVATHFAELASKPSTDVEKLQDLPNSSSRSTRREKLLSMQKKTLTMAKDVMRNNLSASALLKDAARSAPEELNMRGVGRDSLKGEQSRDRTPDSSSGVTKLKVRGPKEKIKAEKSEGPNLFYRTAEIVKKRKEDWNDSTQISPPRKGMRSNSHANEIGQVLITKVFKDELQRNQKRYRRKKLQPVNARDVHYRKNRKDPLYLETYASTLGLRTVKQRPRTTQRTGPVDDRLDLHEGQQFGKDLTLKQSNTSLQISGNEFEVDNDLPDEFTVETKKTRERSIQSLECQGNFLDQNVRNSIELWLSTSGGFEFLDTIDNIDNDDLFKRKSSVPFTQEKVSFSSTIGVSADCRFDKACIKQSIKPNADVDDTGMSPAGFVTPMKIGKGPQGHVVDTLASIYPLSMKGSEDGQAEFPHFVEPCLGHADIMVAKGPPDLNSRTCSQTETVDLSKLSDRYAHEYSSEINNADTTVTNAHQIFQKDSSGDGNTPSLHKALRISPAGGCGTLGAIDQHAVKASPAKSVDAHSPGAEPSRFEKNNQVLSKDSELKLTEREELELALLELVLQTISKDDGAPKNNEKVSEGTSPTPAQGFPVHHFERPSVHSCIPVSSQQEAVDPIVDYGRPFEQGMACGANLPFSGPSCNAHTSGSVNSSEGEWPEYKCFAELQTGLEPCEEGKHWPEYNVVNKLDVHARLDQGARIDDAPSEQISTSSTGDVEVDQKLPSQTLSGRTRPPYSAVHSMRAAERQPIDFPGIASLAFGYPSPRVPSLNPCGPMSIDRSSVSVQTADLAVTQSQSLAPLPSPPPPLPPTSDPYFGVPFYCLGDGRPFLLPYSAYPFPFPISDGLSRIPLGAEDMVRQGQQHPESVLPHFAAMPRNMVPAFPPLLFPPCPPTHRFAPEIPTAQQTSQEQAPTTSAGASHPTNPLDNPQFASHRLDPGAPSQPSNRSVVSTTATAVNLVPPTSGRAISTHLTGLDDRQQIKIQKVPHLYDNKSDSLSSSHSRCSSPTTPSTYISSPEHEARVVSALALPHSCPRGTMAMESVFDADTRIDFYPSKTNGDTVTGDPKKDPPLASTEANGKVEHIPVEKVVAECGHHQLRAGSDLARRSVTNQPATSSGKKTYDSEMSVSADSARSSVLVGSYDGSGSSEGSLQRSSNETAVQASPGGTGVEKVHRFRQMNSENSDRLLMSPTRLQSCGEVLCPSAHSSRIPNLKYASCSATLAVSEGEVEPGQMPSEGECSHCYHNGWGSHFISSWDRNADGQYDPPEPGEIGTMSISKPLPVRAQNIGDEGETNQGISEGELKATTSVEPGEVREL